MCSRLRSSSSYRPKLKSAVLEPSVLLAGLVLVSVPERGLAGGGNFTKSGLVDLASLDCTITLTRSVFLPCEDSRFPDAAAVAGTPVTGGVLALALEAS